MDLRKLETDIANLLSEPISDKLSAWVLTKRASQSIVNQVTELYRKFNSNKPLVLDNEEASLRWAVNKLPVEFTKWFIQEGNSENYYAGIETIKEAYKKFLRRESND